MADPKRIFLRKTSALSIILILYLISSLLHSESWGNILSPINAFASSGILYFSYLKSDRTKKLSETLIFYSLACFAWGTADVIWAVMVFKGISPDNSSIIWVMYFLTNIFILISLFIFAVEQFKKWDFAQYVIDLIISAFMIIMLFWILFLHKDVSILYTILASDFTSITSIVSDMLICMSIFSWYLSIRSGKVPAFMHIILSGTVIFAISDMLYYYIDYHGLYIPNGMMDFVYIVSLAIIAFGALFKTYRNGNVLDLSVTANTGRKMRWAYLIFYPFTAFVFSISGLINTRLSVLDIISFGVPILLYWGLCKYVQFSIEKEAYLKHQNEILEQRVADQISELTFLANQDPLTTLYNRRYFISNLEEAIQSICKGDLLAILMIDLDRFKTINDTYGHDVGDNVLSEISQRMIEWNNHGATFSRLGGDEFAVMFSGKYTKKDIENFCVQIIDICSKPIDAGNMSLNTSISVGIELVTENVCDWKTLMKHADIAMYSAKSQGYNKYRFYDPIIDQNFKQNIEIETLLKQADVEKDFKLYYQPQYSLPDLKLIGAEALIRWDNIKHGFIPPNVFIPIAEEIDCIFKIGEWVMQETIHQSHIWNTKFSTELKVGFNISPRQLNDYMFIKMLEILVFDNTLDPKWIDAEITESVMIDDEEHVRNIFDMLKKLGITISIDDFGSGYSSLNSINKYPYDRIKIDKSLIDNVSSNNRGGTNIVKAAINMAHENGIKVIAEGVENEEQLEILKKLGCDQIQGYLLGRPVPADVFEQRYIIK